MCNRAGLLIGWDYAAKRGLVTRANCDSWDCDECARRMGEKWVLRAQIGVRQFIADGRVVDFITITSHEKLKTFEATQAVWRKSWPVLYAAIKRRNHDLEYFIVPERHKDGRMHVHIIWNAWGKYGAVVLVLSLDETSKLMRALAQSLHEPNLSVTTKELLTESGERT